MRKNNEQLNTLNDESDPEERQEFIWHKSEKNVPSSELKTLIEKIVSEKLHDGDKIFNEVDNVEFAEFDNTTKEKLLNELYEIEIKMLDSGKESDSFFVHN